MTKWEALALGFAAYIALDLFVPAVLFSVGYCLGKLDGRRG